MSSRNNTEVKLLNLANAKFNLHWNRHVSQQMNTIKGIN